MDNFDLSRSPDGKALLEQEPEFAEFAGKALVAMMSTQKDGLTLIGAIYGFYNIGMSIEDIARWFKSVQPFTKPPKDED